MIRTISAILASLLLAIGATSAHGQAPKRGGVFHVPAPEAPTIDPHLNAGFVTQVSASLIYSCLVRLPAGPELRGPGDHRILPDVAEKWEWTSPTTVVFTLRRGVRFHQKPPAYLPMWPRYIAHPSYVKGFKNHDGFGLGSRLMYTWFDR